MKLSQRSLWILGLIFLGVIVLLTLFTAPASNKITQGSTYSRYPDGYGAWYEYMSKQGTPVQRWQKPFGELEKRNNITLLQIIPGLTSESFVTYQAQDWIEKGNTVVLLGVSEPVTAAPFRNLLTHSGNEIKIETRRRKKEAQMTVLGDNQGAIVWSENVGQGQVIYATTPYLAANAYQDYRGNFELLAQLVTQNGKSIWVDEYIHGYKDSETIIEEIGDSIGSYFQRTPLFGLAIQGLILLIVALWAGNRRLGRPTPLATPSVNNSEVYIQGLAEVLHKAQRSEFVVSTLTSAEQRQLQKTLSLGETPLETQALLEAIRQNRQFLPELESLLTTDSQRSSLKEADLQTWLAKWQQVQQQAQGSTEST